MARRLELARLLDRAAVARARPVSGDDLPAGARAGLEARDRARAGAVDARLTSSGVVGRRRGRPLRGARLAARAPGSGSRTGSRAATWPTASSCSTTSPPRYFEGRTCPLAKLGYSRDGKRGTLQIIYGLLCDRPGRPIAIEVFTGELHDDKTLPAPRSTSSRRASASRRVIVVCDRGMVTKANLELMARADGVGWITALKAPQIKKLVARGRAAAVAVRQTNLAEISAPEDYPGERLVVCRNPLVAAERARKREELLAATERGLAADRRARRARHAARRRPDRARRRSRAQALPRQEALRRRDHRHQLHLSSARPSRSTPRPRSTASTCCAPASPRRHARDRRGRARLQGARAGRARLRHLQGPRARDPPDPPPPRRPRPRPRLPLHARLLPHLAPARRPGRRCSSKTSTHRSPPTRSPRPPARSDAQRKAQTKRTTDGEPCHSYKTLLAELATLTRNTIRLPGAHATFDKLTEPTPLQARALDLAANAPVTA